MKSSISVFQQGFYSFEIGWQIISDGQIMLGRKKILQFF